MESMLSKKVNVFDNKTNTIIRTSKPQGNLLVESGNYKHTTKGRLKSWVNKRRKLNNNDLVFRAKELTSEPELSRQGAKLVTLNGKTYIAYRASSKNSNFTLRLAKLKSY